MKKEQILIMMKNVNDLQNSTIHGLDLGVRGFAISKKKELLLPFEKALTFNGSIFKSLYQQAELFQYPREIIDSLNFIISGYINVGIYLKNLIDQDSLDKFKEILSTDPGLIVWRKYSYNEQDIFQYLRNTRNELNSTIEAKLLVNLVLQILVILLIVPSIILIFLTLNKLKKDIGNHNLLVFQKNLELQNSKAIMSHIIRGPICRLRGLFYLLNEEKVLDKNEILERIKQVALEIDELTKTTQINNISYS